MSVSLSSLYKYRVSITIMIGIQFFAPMYLPIAAEGGWKRTNVMKNKETARFRSSGLAPICVVKPRR